MVAKRRTAYSGLDLPKELEAGQDGDHRQGWRRHHFDLRQLVSREVHGEKGSNIRNRPSRVHV
jgi:hypothetical protein